MTKSGFLFPLRILPLTKPPMPGQLGQISRRRGPGLPCFPPPSRLRNVSAGKAELKSFRAQPPKPLPIRSNCRKRDGIYVRGGESGPEHHDPVVAGNVSGASPSPASSQIEPSSPVTYLSFIGAKYTLTPWFGANVIILTRNSHLDRAAMAKMVEAIDRAYSIYAGITGLKPTPYGPYLLDGRTTIAEVPDGATYGASAGYLGHTGIEIVTSFFSLLYEAIRLRGEYDYLVFYELGRNFWFYQDQLGVLDPFLTGFAIANRFISMEVAGLKGGPFNGQLEFGESKKSILHDLLNAFLADANWNWRNTLLVNRSPQAAYGWGAADLAGAMLYRIYSESGYEAYCTF